MSPSLYTAVGILCLFQTVIFGQEVGFYSIIGPGTIRSNFKYNVAISVHEVKEPCQINVKLTGPSYNESKTVEVQPMSTQSVQFDVPTLKNGAYNLTAEGISGIKFKNTTELSYKDYKPQVFIQTDKAIYKPGDLVQFRILFLDANTRPATIGQPVNVIINDGAQNRIKQLNDISLVKGVYADKLQLSEQPILGNWEIEVLFGDENQISKSFEVAKYVLPKFEVSIETAKDVAVPDGVIKITMRSKYTYGKSVKGKATVSVKPTYHYYGDSNNNLEAEKTINIDGKAHLEFDLIKELHVSADRTYVPPLKITVIVEEELTGIRQNATATITLHAEKYRIESIDTPYTYHPGKPITFNVAIKYVDGSPVIDTKNKAKLIVDPPKSYFYRGVEPPSATKPEEQTMEFESNLDERGIATFEFLLPENNNTFYSIKCSFQETVSYLSSLSKFIPIEEKLQGLKLVLNTKEPQLGKDISISVQSPEQITYFVYTIVARGNILKAEYVKVPEGRNTHTIEFTPSFSMVPKAKLFVHYVHDKDLHFEEISIKFMETFENFINITAPSATRPGENVELTIKSDPESYVGLLGVDQSVLLLKTGNDLNKDAIFKGLADFDTFTPYIRGYGRYPGQESGLVTMTNAHYPFNDDEFLHIVVGEEEIVALALEDVERGGSWDSPDSDTISTTSSAVQNIRKHFNENWIFDETELYSKNHILQLSGRMNVHVELQTALPVALYDDVQASSFKTSPINEPQKIHEEFPDSWIFTDVNNTSTDGFVLRRKIPDTITSWVITGFALSPKTGLALTENPTKIRVFQPFFLSTNLPYSVKRGEVIAVPVIIFNYMDKALDAEVVLDNSDSEFEFTEATNEIEETALNEIKRVKRTTVPSNTGKSLSFMIRPKKVGSITLKINAKTPLAGDAIHQMLNVEPEGITQYENHAVFISLNELPEYNYKFNIDIPAGAVLDSEYIEFSVVGDLLGPTIKNLDKLVRMPYGCGEQNMVNFVPNILVLKYLDTVKKDWPSIAEKAKKFLEIGYQRELTYKHDDGSYSAFGKSDNAGSTWLTAYVMRSFHQAANYTDIDPNIIVDGLNFLASKQADNGSFPEYGKLFDSAHQNELGLTAFVLLAFFENAEHIVKYQEQIEKGVQYILDNVDASDDQYALSIAVLALQITKNPKADKLLAKLKTLAKQENNRRWWSKDEPKKDETERSSLSHLPHSNAVEITSYILLALLQKEPADSVLPIIKWLISKRNSNGGFSSTQDTVVGLQALIMFAEKVGSGVGNMTIEFIPNTEDKNNGSFTTNKENALLLQTQVLPKTTREVQFNAKGKGSAMVQLSYRYNIADKDNSASFKLNTTVRENAFTKKLNIDVCAEYVPLLEHGDNQESNMVVVEVALPSGYTTDTECFENIESVDRVKRTESQNSDSVVIVYFDGLTAKEIKCIPVEASRTHAVAKQKPAAITIYDYYDTKRRATDYYEVQSSLCDICEGDDCGIGCKKE